MVRTRAPRQAFGLTLRHLMRRPTYDVTPGLLAKLSGPQGQHRQLDRRPCRTAAIDERHRSGLRRIASRRRRGRAHSSTGVRPCRIRLYSTTVDGRVLCANDTLVTMIGYDRRAYYGLDVGRDLAFESRERSLSLDEIKRIGTLIRRPVIGRWRPVRRSRCSTAAPRSTTGRSESFSSKACGKERRPFVESSDNRRRRWLG